MLGYWRDHVEKPLDLLRTQVTDDHPRVRLEAVRALSFFNGADTKRAIVTLAAGNDIPLFEN